MSAFTTAGRRFNVAGIADELKELPRWVRFGLERTARGKLKKTPYIPGTMFEASNRNRAHWRPFDVAVADALARNEHIGFVFDRSVPYVFVDKDHALGAGGVMHSGAARVVDALRAPTERSASGAGLHIVCRGLLPESIEIAPDLRPIEVYPLRGPRYCVFTGDLLPVEGNLSGEIPDRTEALAALFPPRLRPAPKDEASSHGGVRGELTSGEVERIVNWAGDHWTDGRRHHMALYLSGYLAKTGVSRKQTTTIIKRCAEDDSDPGAKAATYHDTFDDLEAGVDVSGWHGLKDVCGLTEEELAPLALILDAVWRRSRPRPLRLRRAPKLLLREMRHA